MRWRLFQCFKEGVESGLREHVHLVYDEYLVLACLWRYKGLLHERLYVLHRVVACRVKLKDVHRPSLVEGPATLTLVASLTVACGVLAIYGFREDAGASGLSHSTRPAKEKSMCQLARPNGIIQGCGKRILPHHRRECHWPVFPCGNNIVVHR